MALPHGLGHRDDGTPPKLRQQYGRSAISYQVASRKLLLYIENNRSAIDGENTYEPVQASMEMKGYRKGRSLFSLRYWITQRLAMTSARDENS